MQSKQNIFIALACWALLLALVTTTRPEKLPVVFLIVPFIVLFVALYETWQLLAGLYHRFLARREPARPSRRLAATVCASVVLLLAMQSLGQLTPRDAITVAAITTIGYIYAARNYTKRSKS